MLTVRKIALGKATHLMHDDANHDGRGASLRLGGQNSPPDRKKGQAKVEAFNAVA